MIPTYEGLTGLSFKNNLPEIQHQIVFFRIPRVESNQRGLFPAPKKPSTFRYISKKKTYLPYIVSKE